MKDRRLHPRAPLETAVECQLAQGKGRLRALSRHVGTGGLGIVTSAKLSVGAALSRIRFTLPAEGNIPETTLELGAQVVRCTEASEPAGQFVAGLEFLEASRADLERIEDYVFRRLSPEARAAATAAAEEAKAAEESLASDVPEDLEELVDLVDIETIDLETADFDRAELETASEEQSADAEPPSVGEPETETSPPGSDALHDDEDKPARRIPFSQPISIRFDLFKDFVKEVSANLSTSGMFIEAAKPRKVGSVLEFSFDMGDDFTLLQGSGEVVWARFQREGPELPPGMGIRFMDLDPSSRNVIKRMVTDHTAQGHQPFDLDASAPTDLPLAEAGLEEALEPEVEGELVELEEVNPELRERLRALLRAKRERDELLQRLKKSEREKYALEKELAGIGAGAQKAQLGWKARLAELEQTVVGAESVETDLKGKIEELASSLAAAFEERDRLSAQRDELITQQEKLAGQSESHRSSDAEIEALTAETEELRSETAKKQKELQEEVAATRVEASESRSKAEALEAEIEELRTRLEDDKAELETAREQAGKLDAQRGRLAELEAELEESRQKLEGARDDVGRLEKDCSRLESKVAEDATLISAARDSEDTLSSERNDFEAQLTLAAETESELTARVAELETEAGTARKEAELNLEQSGAQRAELKTKLERALEEMDRLLDLSETAKKDFEAELTEKVSAVEETEEKQRELQASIESLDRDLEAAQNEIESTRSAADKNLEEEREKSKEAEGRLSELEEELSQAVQSKEELESKREQLEKELQASHDETSEKDEQQSAAVSKLEVELETALASLQETRTKSGEELAELRGESAKAKADLEGMLAETTESEAKLSEQLDELRNEVEQETDKASKEQADLHNRIEELESQLAEATDAHSEAESQLESRLAELQSELEHERNAAELREGVQSAAPLPYPSSLVPAASRRSRYASWGAGLAAGLLLGAVAVFALYRFSDLDLPRLGGAGEPVSPATAARAVNASSPDAIPSGAGTVSEPAAEVEASADTAEPDSDEPTTGIDQPAETSATGSDEVAKQPNPAIAEEAVRAWAASWSDQQVDDYLSHYAADFTPEDGSARSDWVQQRRVRVARPASLQVTVRGLERDILAPDRVRITFNQAYQSDTFGDEVNKTLELVWEEDDWKIIREFSDPS